MCSINRVKAGILSLWCVMIMGLCGCAMTPVSIQTVRSDELPAPEIIGRPGTSPGHPDSRVLASHRLNVEGYELLTRGDVDGAIRALERAVSVNPSNGPGYYYLAEAWTGKGNYDLALQFNSLAGIYVRTNHLWADYAEIQKDKIEGFVSNP